MFTQILSPVKGTNTVLNSTLEVNGVTMQEDDFLLTQRFTAEQEQEIKSLAADASIHIGRYEIKRLV